MSDPPDRLEDLFAAVLALPADERAEFLNRTLQGEPALRQRLEALLRAHDEPGHFIDRPLGGIVRTAAYLPREQTGATIAGRYKLLEQLGEGGMGTVWVAEQTQPVRRKVALKLIKAGMDSKSVLARFEAERQALALMDHPNIAKVLDGGLTDAGRPFFVMEYVKGIPITEYCDARRLTVPERLRLFVQVCHAVRHAHQKGIIHRDLKPSNILVAPYDDRPVPKVIDFGLAKAMHQTLTERTLHTAHETLLGTPLYMAPEQAQINNLDVDTRCDVYSLGVLLYELLTGTTPVEKKRFKEAAWDEIRRVISEEEPPRPSMRLSSSEALASVAAQRQIEPARLGKLVRGDLDWIVMKALAKERDRRYATANAFADDVEHYLSDEPVSAGPPTMAYRFGKFAKRHRGRVVFASLLLAAMVAGLAGTVMGLIRAHLAEAQISDALSKVTAEQARTKDALSNAERNRLDAELQRDAARGRLSRQYVEKAVDLADRNNPIGGLPWLVESLVLDEAGSRGAGSQRLRLGGVLQQSPKLVNFWPDATCATLDADGRRLAVGFERAVRVVAVGSDELLVPPLATRGAVSEILFLSDQRRIVVICNLADVLGRRTTAQLWDIMTGQPLTPETPIGNREKGATEVRLSTDGRHLVALWVGHLNRHNVNTEVFLYETTKLNAIGRPLINGHDESYDRVVLDLGRLRALTFVRDTPSGSLDFKAEAQVWDLLTGDALFEAIAAKQWIASGQFDPQATRFALALRNSARIYDAASGEPLTPDMPPVSGEMVETVARLLGALNIAVPWSAGPSHVAFSPDGGRLATLGNEQIQIWDTATGKAILTIPHIDSAYTLGYAPDGTSVYVLGGGGFFSWDAATGDQQLVVPNDDRDGVRSMEFNPDRIHLVTAGRTGVSVWRRAGGPSLAFLPHGAPVKTRFSGDGRFLLAIGNGARLWDLAGATGRLSRFTALRDGEMQSVEIHSQSPFVACIDSAGRIESRNSQTDARRAPPRFIAGEWISAAVSPDGRYFVTRGWPAGESTSPDQEEADRQMYSPRARNYVWHAARVLQVWDVATGKAVGRPLRHRVVDRFLFHPDCQTLIVAGSYQCSPAGGVDQTEDTSESEIHRWNMLKGTPHAPARRIPGHLELVAISADGHHLLVRAPRPEKTSLAAAQLWDAATLEPASPLLGPTDQSVLKAVLDPSGRLVATMSENGEAQIWNANAAAPLGGRLRHLSTQVGANEPIRVATFSPDGMLIATGTGEHYLSAGQARVWEASTGRPVTPVLTHPHWVRNVVFSPDQTYVATVGVAENRGWETRVWEVTTGLPITAPVPVADAWYPVVFPDYSPVPQFTADGARLLIQTNRTISVLHLAADHRPADDLQHLARLLSGHEIDSTGGYQPLSEAAARAAWDRWRDVRPHDRLPVSAGDSRRYRESLVQTAVDHERWDVVFTITTALLDETPNEAWLWAGKADAARRLGRWAELQAALQQVLRLEPNPQAEYGLGEALAEQRRYAEAVPHFDRAWKTSGWVGHGVALACAQWAARELDSYRSTCEALRDRHFEFAGRLEQLAAVALVVYISRDTATESDPIVRHLKTELPVSFKVDDFAPALALANLRQGDADAAETVLKDALVRSPLLSQAVLGLALKQAGDTAAANKLCATCRHRYRTEIQGLRWRQRLLIETILEEAEEAAHQ